MAKRKQAGHEVKYAVFSSCRESVPEGFPEETLEIELNKAVEILGLDPGNDLILYDFSVRTFSDHRQPILDELIKLRSDYKPDIVLCPSLNDLHQDHSTVAHEAVRAFKKNSILCYEEPWNNLAFVTTAFEKLSRSDLNKKIEALRAYQSQSDRPYFNEDAIRSLAFTRGCQLDGGWAEAFEIVRWML